MSKQVVLIQGSAEWHDHRRNHCNASEAGAVMNVSPWFPKNPSQLWDLKKGIKEVHFNSNMQHGIDTEPAARAYAESRLGDDFTPAVYVNGVYSASLDGINFDATFGIEIKCPVNPDSKLFELTTPQEVLAKATHYWYQIVHQFMCVPSMKRLAFVIYHQARQNIVVIERPEAERYFPYLLKEWEAFTKAMHDDVRPVEEEWDDSDEFQNLVQAYKLQKLKVEAEEAALKIVDEQIKTYAKNTGKEKVAGFGATVTLVTRQGNIDYKKVPELKGIDLEKYRGKTTTYWMVKV